MDDPVNVTDGADASMLDCFSVDDAINRSGGDNTIYVLDGADAPSGGGGTEEINGNSDAGTISGNACGVIVAIKGNAGNDIRFGFIGFDNIDRGDDNDTIDSGHSDDTLIGCQEADQLIGGSKQDSVRGRGGDDSLLGDIGTETLNGGSGANTLGGGAASDISNGGPIDETKDSLDGSDDDSMTLGVLDKGTGGEGADTFALETPTKGAISITDFEDGADVPVANFTGTDPDLSGQTVDITAGSEGVPLTFDISATVILSRLTAEISAYSIAFVKETGDTSDGAGTGGTAGAAYITRSAAVDCFSGLAGADTQMGWARANTPFGGDHDGLTLSPRQRLPIRPILTQLWRWSGWVRYHGPGCWRHSNEPSRRQRVCRHGCAGSGTVTITDFDASSDSIRLEAGTGTTVKTTNRCGKRSADCCVARWHAVGYDLTARYWRTDHRRSDQGRRAVHHSCPPEDPSGPRGGCRAKGRLDGSWQIA